MNFVPYVFLVVVALLVMASAVGALYWAAKTGQFDRLEQDATVIFDEEEPVGRTTDAYPGKTPAPPPPAAPAGAHR